LNMGWDGDGPSPIRKFTLAGTVLISNRYGSDRLVDLIPTRALTCPHDISADEKGNIYQTGSFFSEGIKFGPDSLENILTRIISTGRHSYSNTIHLGNPVWGKAAGDIHCDAGRAIQVVSEDTFYLSGNLESKQIKFGKHILLTTAYCMKPMSISDLPGNTGTPLFSWQNNSDVTYTPPVDGKNRFNLYPNPAGDFISFRNR
jgi:hypothetical protein